MPTKSHTREFSGVKLIRGTGVPSHSPCRPSTVKQREALASRWIIYHECLGVLPEKKKIREQLKCHTQRLYLPKPQRYGETSHIGRYLGICRVRTTYLNTYDHTHWRTRDPVRSPIDKSVRARLVVGSVTNSESLVLYVFFPPLWVPPAARLLHLGAM